jgi:predicted metal-dependent hydrolase
VTETWNGSAFLRDYVAYYRRDFHPWQLDSRRGLQSFQDELATGDAYTSFVGGASRL